MNVCTCSFICALHFTVQRTLAHAACTITQTTRGLVNLCIFLSIKKKKKSKFGRSYTFLRILVLICLLVFNHTSHIYGLRRWRAQISELGPIRSFHTCYLVSCAYDSVRRYLANDVEHKYRLLPAGWPGRPRLMNSNLATLALSVATTFVCPSRV